MTLRMLLFSAPLIVLLPALVLLAMSKILPGCGRYGLLLAIVGALICVLLMGLVFLMAFVENWQRRRDGERVFVCISQSAMRTGDNSYAFSQLLMGAGFCCCAWFMVAVLSPFASAVRKLF